MGNSDKAAAAKKAAETKEKKEVTQTATAVKKANIAELCKKYGVKEIYRNSHGEHFTSKGLAISS